MKYRDFQKYIKKVTEKEVEEYAPTEEDDYEPINGERTKRFVRFSSDLFQDLIDELKNNPDCCYCTYVNDLIRGGYTPEYISVLLKEENRLVTDNDEFRVGHL